MSRNGRRSVKTSWEIELYPFSTVYPTKNEPQGASGPVTTLTKGVISLRIMRAKGTEAGSCSFTVVGPVPETCFPGTWIIAVATSMDDRGQKRKVDKFIGQIYDMTPGYVTSAETGLINLRTNFIAREWSAILGMNVRYDLTAIARAVSSNASLSGISLAQATGKPELSLNQQRNIVSKTFTAYELAHLILSLIGAIGENDKLGPIRDLGNTKLPEVALRMPSIPKSLLSRLNLDDVKANAPFSSGFVSTITGIQKEGVYNDGNWDGIWSAQQTSIESYKKNMNTNPPDRPITVGLAALAEMGGSAWGLITKYCDPSNNEFFTDILYERSEDGASLIAKPAIFIRDKPFLMQRFKKLHKSGLNSWTVYDNLPRVRIDNVYIESFQFKNTFINSPNFIRMEFVPQDVDSDTLRAIAQLEQSQLSEEMDRFGGDEFVVETQFLSSDIVTGRNPDISLPEWYKRLRTVATYWHSYNYRMGSGSLKLKDDNIPFTVGMNVQFKVGEFELVGHVDSVDITATMGETGHLSTVTTLQISRIVHEFKGQLEFIPPRAMTNLFQATPAVVADGEGFTDTILSSMSEAISKVSELFDEGVQKAQAILSRFIG